MRKFVLITMVFASLAALSLSASAQVKTRVRFSTGTHGTSVKGTVRGYEYRDYVVGASAGQKMTVSIDASAMSTVFTVFDPAGDNLDGAAERNNFSGELPAKGDYVIRVLMLRSQARRRGSISNYTLKITIR
ncbi:MAG: hypothetical protein ABJA02_03590 [Acidobacteriota bacterium]